MAVHALSKLGEEAVQPLLDAYTSAVPRGRIHIMRALAELRDSRAIRLMMDSLEGESAALQYWAQEGLERLGLNMVYMKPD
jgi:HEAT repeat protein